MFRRTLAAVVTSPNAKTGDSAMFVGYDVESREEIVCRQRLRIERGRPGPPRPATDPTRPQARSA